MLPGQGSLDIFRPTSRYSSKFSPFYLTNGFHCLLIRMDNIILQIHSYFFRKLNVKPIFLSSKTMTSSTSTNHFFGKLTVVPNCSSKYHISIGTQQKFTEIRFWKAKLIFFPCWAVLTFLIFQSWHFKIGPWQTQWEKFNEH